MAMKIYRFLQLGPFLLSVLATTLAQHDYSGSWGMGFIMGLIVGGVVLFCTTVVLNIVWNIFGLWPRSES